MNHTAFHLPRLRIMAAVAAFGLLAHPAAQAHVLPAQMQSPTASKAPVPLATPAHNFARPTSFYEAVPGSFRSTVAAPQRGSAFWLVAESAKAMQPMGQGGHGQGSDHGAAHHQNGAHHEAVTADSAKFRAGDITVTSPWTRATPGGAKIAGGYLKITNTGKIPDRLVSATTPIAGHVEIHEMSMEGGVMKMRPLADGLSIKPGQSVALTPGGFHMMLMDLKQPLKQGDTLKATLQFEKAGSLDVTFRVEAIGASEDSGHKH